MSNIYTKVFGIIFVVSLLLLCSATAAATGHQDQNLLFSNKSVVVFAEKNIQNFTGSKIDGISRIDMMKTYFGDVYQVTTKTGNVFNINVKSGRIETAIIQTGLEDPLAGKDLSGMKTIAESFARTHYPGFADKKMVIIESRIIDHGDMGKEYLFSWNAKSDDAYTLSAVTISYFPDDNVMHYHGTDYDLLVDTTPTITKLGAHMVGERTFSMGPGAETQSKLVVMPSGDSQRLGWIVTTASYDRDGIAHGGSVIIDAISGEILSTNPFN
jgi:hypothetical protein